MNGFTHSEPWLRTVQSGCSIHDRFHYNLNFTALIMLKNPFTFYSVSCGFLLNKTKHIKLRELDYL